MEQRLSNDVAEIILSYAYDLHWCDGCESWQCGHDCHHCWFSNLEALEYVYNFDNPVFAWQCRDLLQEFLDYESSQNKLTNDLTSMVKYNEPYEFRFGYNPPEISWEQNDHGLDYKDYQVISSFLRHSIAYPPPRSGEYRNYKYLSFEASKTQSFSAGRLGMYPTAPINKILFKWKY